MQQRLALAVLIIVAGQHFACAGGTGVSAQQPEEITRDRLVGPLWEAQSVAGAGLVEGTRITLELDELGGISGSGGCNRYHGGYTLENGILRFAAQIASTKMACPPPILDQETRFFGALQSTKSARLEAGALVLAESSDGPETRLVAVSTPLD